MLCLLSTRELLSDAEPLASALREAQHPDAPVWQSLFQKCLPSARAERDGLIICQVASFCIAPGQAKGDYGARLRVRVVENEEQLEAFAHQPPYFDLRSASARNFYLWSHAGRPRQAE